jgi:hypothetical protein
MDGRLGGPEDGRTERCEDGTMRGRKDGRTERREDGGSGGPEDGRKERHTACQFCSFALLVYGPVQRHLFHAFRRPRIVVNQRRLCHTIVLSRTTWDDEGLAGLLMGVGMRTSCTNTRSAPAPTSRPWSRGEEAEGIAWTRGTRAEEPPVSRSYKKRTVDGDQRLERGRAGPKPNRPTLRVVMHSHVDDEQSP